jgi:hypothetical protein
MNNYHKLETVHMYSSIEEENYIRILSNEGILKGIGGPANQKYLQ